MLSLLVPLAASGPERVALPAPFPLTYGANTLPANGAVIGLELGSALRGQEVFRASVVTEAFGIGVADRVGVAVSHYAGNRGGDASGTLFRVKTRLGDWFGPRSSVGVHLAYAKMQRVDLPAQSDRLSMIDLAVPAEFLLTPASNRAKVSAFVGPRFTRENYSDHLDARQNMHSLYVGAVGGVHWQFRALNLFAEATLAHVPKSTYLGVSHGGGITVLPQFGFLVRLGDDHKWKQK